MLLLILDPGGRVFCGAGAEEVLDDCTGALGATAVWLVASDFI